MTHASGGSVGIAHPQVDHVDPVAPLAVLQLVDLAEEIRRQAPDPRRDLEVVVLDRLVLLGTGIGLVVDHRGTILARATGRLGGHGLDGRPWQIRLASGSGQSSTLSITEPAVAARSARADLRADAASSAGDVTVAVVTASADGGSDFCEFRGRRRRYSVYHQDDPSDSDHTTSIDPTDLGSIRIIINEEGPARINPDRPLSLLRHLEPAAVASGGDDRRIADYFAFLVRVTNRPTLPVWT